MQFILFYHQARKKLQAIGIGDCIIITQTTDDEKVKLNLTHFCDTLYVPEARHNLLSANKLEKDHFQVVFLAQNPVFARKP